jgi:hypothetical protein
MRSKNIFSNNYLVNNPYKSLVVASASVAALSLYGFYKCKSFGSKAYSEDNVSKFTEALGQQFIRVNNLTFDQEKYLIQTPDNFYTVFTGENKDNELSFAIRAIVKTRKTIPFAANRLDDYYAEISHTKNVPPKTKPWHKDSAIERFQSKIATSLFEEHFELGKIYGFRKIAYMDDEAISKLLSTGKKYHGVCVDMARLAVYNINHNENSEYIACKANFSDNKDIFPENTLGGVINPKNLTVSNNHAFTIAFRKDNFPTKTKITWADAVKYNAVIVDPWFKMTFKASDSNALKYIFYSIKAVYSLELAESPQKHYIEELYSTIKKLDQNHDSDIDLNKVLEVDLDETFLFNPNIEQDRVLSHKNFDGRATL